MFEQSDESAQSMRERELELRVARLEAELATASGEGEPTDIAARFLAMAASTVDMAIEDARREADEIAAEVSANAEARRDEATRLASEAEARAEALARQADDHQSILDAARSEADTITEGARHEAETLIAAERARVGDEIQALSEVREALESERGALESYHEELQRRVQELAESMVAFMTTEPPLGAVGAIENLAVGELDASPEVEPAPVIPTPPPAPAFASAPAPPPAPAPVGTEAEAIPSSSLFARSDDSVDEEAPKPSLFGSHGARLIEQTSPSELAAALGEASDDNAFRSFIAGDQEADPSREWLLRPEQH